MPEAYKYKLNHSKWLQLGASQYGHVETTSCEYCQAILGNPSHIPYKMIFEISVMKWIYNDLTTLLLIVSTANYSFGVSYPVTIWHQSYFQAKILNFSNFRNFQILHSFEINEYIQTRFIQILFRNSSSQQQMFNKYEFSEQRQITKTTTF